MNQYLETNYRLSYFCTKEGAEVDLVLSLGKKLIFIEIKSSNQVDEVEVNKLSKFGTEFTLQLYYISNDPHPQMIEGVRCLQWSLGIAEILGQSIQ